MIVITAARQNFSILNSMYDGGPRKNHTLRYTGWPPYRTFGPSRSLGFTAVQLQNFRSSMRSSVCLISQNIIIATIHLTRFFRQLVPRKSRRTSRTGRAQAPPISNCQQGGAHSTLLYSLLFLEGKSTSSTFEAPRSARKRE